MTVRLAISPATAPPTPSATATSRGLAKTESSLFARRLPTSLRAVASSCRPATTAKLAIPMPMPAEWAPHERTLVAWPCRRELWGPALADARRETAGVANAIAAFEPVLMVCRPGDGAEARGALAGEVEIWETPIDDSWLRDSGPIVVTEDGERR